MTIVESGWNVWVWLVGVVSRKQVWLVWLQGGTYIDFLILLIPTPLVFVLFLQQHPYFLFIFLNVFRSCSGTFCNKIMYYIIFSLSLNTHTGNYGRPKAAI